MAIDTPHPWDRPANDLRRTKERLARVRSRFAQLLRNNNPDNATIYYQLIQLEDLEADLSNTRFDINDIGEQQKDRVLRLIREYEDKLEAYERKLRDRNNRIRELERENSDLRSRVPLPPRDPSPRPPPPAPPRTPPVRPPRRVIHIPIPTRKHWLRRLELLDETSSYQNVIINGDVSEVRSLIQRGRQIPSSALHVAALFGETQIASLLLNERRSLVNQAITIRRLKPNYRDNQYHSYGVTPMHIAIGAQQHSMILLLYNNGASIRRTVAAGKNKAVAPPRYLLLDGWLEMIGCRDPMDVIATVDLLRERPMGWDINAVLDANGKTILDFALELDVGIPGFRDKVSRELQRRGATI